MTVAELIEQLSEMDQTLEVSIDTGGKSVDVSEVKVVTWVRKDGSSYQAVEIA